MQNARLGESKAGIKIAGRNINNLRYADEIGRASCRERKHITTMLGGREVKHGNFRLSQMPSKKRRDEGEKEKQS